MVSVSGPSVEVCGRSRGTYWLDREGYDLEAAFSYQMNARDTQEVRKIVFEHFDYILRQWDEFERRKKNG